MGDLQAIQNIVLIYEQASGQQINREKTTVFFNKLVSEEMKVAIKIFWGVTKIREYEHYLGLPAVVGRNKKDSLNYSKERVWNKL